MNISAHYMVLGPVQTNVYIFVNKDTGKCVITDPADRADLIIRELDKLETVPEAILLTHGHYDHIGAVSALREHYGPEALPVYAAAPEAEVLARADLNQSAFSGTPVEIKADRLLEDGQMIEPAGIRMKAVLTPGHTRGGCCYYIEEENLLISGDTLFQRSVGRCDLPTGDEDTLLSSIKEKLMVLPDETNVLPGHGGATTIGYERKYNPFLRYIL